MEYTGPERRKHPRAEYRFVVSYRVLEEEGHVDISQTKNLSLGGMWLTTNRKFGIGAKLSLEMRLPFDPDPIKLVAAVVESKEVVENLIYDTHLSFLSIDEKHKKIIGKTVERYLGKKEE
jgi:c-di-GMP-binding flagellar brake protein YcgR